jgi:nicotinamide-nucleotide amidase
VAKIDELIFIEAKKLGQKLYSTNDVIAVAESCTAGIVAGAITDVANSSKWFDRGFVSYTNNSKMQMLDVKESTLNTYGAVSKEVVEEMALGALKHSEATYAISVSGIAGPTGATEGKPIGTVWISFAHNNEIISSIKMLFDGDRKEVRTQAVYTALSEFNRLLGVED